MCVRQGRVTVQGLRVGWWKRVRVRGGAVYGINQCFNDFSTKHTSSGEVKHMRFTTAPVIFHSIHRQLLAIMIDLCVMLLTLLTNLVYISLNIYSCMFKNYITPTVK